jgi:hypothetical protein
MRIMVKAPVSCGRIAVVAACGDNLDEIGPRVNALPASALDALTPPQLIAEGVFAGG